MRFRAFLFFPVCIISSVLTAQTVEGVLEMDWKGFSSGYYEGFENPEYNIVLTMYDVVADGESGSFTAHMQSDIMIDYAHYYSISSVTGFLDLADGSVVIRFEYSVRKDALPNEMYWIDNDMYGTMYADADEPGYYFIKGNDGDNDFELSNYPY